MASYVVHWGDGNTDTYASNGVKTHTYADGPASRAITVTSSTRMARASTAPMLSVSRSPTSNPVVTLSGADSTNEGDSVHYTFSITDAGSADTFTVSMPRLRPQRRALRLHLHGNAGSFNCTWADNFANEDVSVDVSDDDGGTDCDAISVDVANVKPSVSLSGPD